MARKQARRRKTREKRSLRWPVLPVRRLAAVIVAVGVVAGTYRFSAEMLDRPIESITIEGPFQRVSALQVEEAIGPQLGAGFVSADLTRIQQDIVALPWIDDASVARRWPGRLEISLTEQVPAAVWGGRGLLNTRGDLFVSEARHLPAELPRLEGPEGSSAEVAARYLALKERLLPFGLDLREVTLDARGAWRMTLTNGVELRIGRRDVDDRIERFVSVAAEIVSSREAEIAFVDMRYGNGFTIGWKGGEAVPERADAEAGPSMVAGLNE